MSRKKFCLSLHYDRANSYLFVNGLEIIKFKAKDSEIVAVPLCLGKTLLQIIWKKTGLYGDVYDFSVDYDAIAVDDILEIHKYLIKKICKMFEFIKKCFLQQWFLVAMHWNMFQWIIKNDRY